MIPEELLVEAAEAYGTPLYVYDLDAVEGRISSLRAALPARSDLAYAVKANPSGAVLRRVAESGIGADVASAGELEAARRAGIDPERTVMTGPGKRDDELSAAAAVPLRAVTVESPGELERLRQQARARGAKVRILLRAAGDDGDGNVIGSGHGRFGMRWADLVAAARVAADAQELDLIGLHRFDASNLLDAGALLERAHTATSIAASLAREAGVALSLVDIGGGLGIPYGDEPELDVAAFGAGLEVLLNDLDADPHLAGARILVEPGRYLVGQCGVYVVRVVDVKSAESGARIVTVDGGIHHLLRPALVSQPHRIRLVAPHAADRRPRRQCVVGGPLCTSLDMLGEVVLADPQVGDLLAVLDAGAYGFTESMPFFLSHPTPPEVVVAGGRLDLAQPRIGPRAWLDAASGAALTSGTLDT